MSKKGKREEADIEQMSRSMRKCTNIYTYMCVCTANENWNRRIKNAMTTPRDDTYACNNLPHIGRTLDVRVYVQRYSHLRGDDPAETERSNGGEAIIETLNDANNHRNLLSRFVPFTACAFARGRKKERKKGKKEGRRRRERKKVELSPKYRRAQISWNN